MKSLRNLAIVFSILIQSVLIAQENNPFEKYEMKTYYVVFLKAGPNRSQDSTTVQKLQEQHLKHLNKMYEEGKMDLCGPFLDENEIKGICIYNLATKTEVEKLANEDPMVIAGRLIVEIHPLYSAKGSTLK